MVETHWYMHATFQTPRTTPSGRKVKLTVKHILKGGYQNLFKGWNLILLVTEGRIQNVITLGQSCLWEIRWGLLLFLLFFVLLFFFFLFFLLFFLLLLLRESKVNSQFWIERLRVWHLEELIFIVKINNKTKGLG